MKQIIREIEISKLTGEELTGDIKEIVDWFDDLFSKMEYSKLDNHPNSLFFHIKGDYYFEQDDKNDRLWCHYDRVWSVFESKYKLNYNETSDLIKYLVEELVEEQLKCRVGTPRNPPLRILSSVEEQLKCRVGTPSMVWARLRD